MARGVKFGHCLMVNTPDHREGWDMRRLFGTDETYYAVIFILLDREWWLCLVWV